MQQSPHFFQTFRIVENCSQLTSQTETSNGMTHAGRGGEERGTALPASPSQAQLVEAGVPPPAPLQLQSLHQEQGWTDRQPHWWRVGVSERRPAGQTQPAVLL